MLNLWKKLETEIVELARSRFLNLSQMDATSKVFFSLEGKNCQSLHSLFMLSGCTGGNRNISIRKRAIWFYARLCGSDYVEDDDLSVHLYEGLPRVSESSKVELKRPLCEQELFIALYAMERGKAPGIDGLTVEF